MFHQKTRMSVNLMKNVHLLLSAVLLLVIALAYGFDPKRILPRFFNLQISTTDTVHIFRSLMGLYLAMLASWFWGAFKPAFWKTATIINILFMSGLAAGRIISFMADGWPSALFIIGCGGEIFLAAWGAINLFVYPETKSR